VIHRVPVLPHLLRLPLMPSPADGFGFFGINGSHGEFALIPPSLFGGIQGVPVRDAE